MLLGHLDAVNSAGTIEGWAYDSALPAEPLLVAIADDTGEEIACGLAHHYRQDLVEAGCGIGWCYFRLRAKGLVSRLRNTPVRLSAKQTGTVILRLERLPYTMELEDTLSSIEKVANSDPSVCNSVDQLAGCDEIFNSFIESRGVEEFVRKAHVYIFGHGVKIEDLSLYCRLMRQQMLTPFALLLMLAKNAELQSNPRNLVAPIMDNFPFKSTASA